jgi:hypothetical protein
MVSASSSNDTVTDGVPPVGTRQVVLSARSQNRGRPDASFAAKWRTKRA